MHIIKSTRGFSLIELIVVVAIISILSAVAIPAYYNYTLRTQQAVAYNKLFDMKAAQEMFYTQYNEYGSPSADGSTFTSLLSFQFADTAHYVFGATVNSGGNGFQAWAVGASFTKFSPNRIELTHDTDEPVETIKPGGFKLSLIFD